MTPAYHHQANDNLTKGSEHAAERGGDCRVAKTEADVSAKEAQLLASDVVL
jgi:hypothetical protein